MLNHTQQFTPPSGYCMTTLPFNQCCCNQIKNQNNSKYQKAQTNQRTRFPFSIKEDQLLIHLVKQYGTKDKINWYIIAMHIEGRTARQCRERYQLYLSDGIKRKEKWTKEEDETLLKQYSILGPKWKKMEQFFEGRTSYSIKNRFISLKKKRNKIAHDHPVNQSLSTPSITVKHYCLPLKFKNYVPKNSDIINVL